MVNLTLSIMEILQAVRYFQLIIKTYDLNFMATVADSITRVVDTASFNTIYI